jgi:zinc D-Ala-D-Ala carboxypeptidase
VKLTPNFDLAEFTRSETALRYGIRNEPNEMHLANIRVTALGLQMVRMIVRRVLPNAVVRITSGYRSPELNRHPNVGGSPTSAHALGWAADITVEGLSLAELARLLEGALPYDQLIYEHNRCVHISFDPRLRGQALTQRGGPGTPIEAGILD